MFILTCFQTLPNIFRARYFYDSVILAQKILPTCINMLKMMSCLNLNAYTHMQKKMVLQNELHKRSS